MADSNMVLKLALFGGAAYLAYQYLFATPATSVATPASSAPATPTVAAATGRTLDSVYQAMLKAANGLQSTGADGWNALLMQGTPAIAAPDPVPVFTAGLPGWQRSDQMSAAAYWAVMGPAVKAQYGLSGLGFYASAFQPMRRRVA